MSSRIEWTDETWNPVRGCSRVSPGCDHCYAMRMAHRQDWRTPADQTGEPERTGGYHGLTIYREKGPRAGVDWSGVVRFHPEMLELPLRWRRPRRIFVNSMSDIFHESLTNQEIAAVFGIMAACRRHTFQVLTKRAKRMREWFEWAAERRTGLLSRERSARFTCVHFANEALDPEHATSPRITTQHEPWPLPNVVLLVSAENQKMADERIPHLLATPAAVRGVSVEPMLGPMDLRRIEFSRHYGSGLLDALTGVKTTHPVKALDGSEHCDQLGMAAALDWVICGGESGHGARPMHPDWARSLRDQCAEAKVPFFFKQHGDWTWDEHPQTLTSRVRWLEHDGTVHDFTPMHLIVAPPVKDACLVRRVGKKRAGRLLDGARHDEYPEMDRDKAA